MLLVVSTDVNQQSFNDSGTVTIKRQTAQRAPSSVTQMPESPPACVNLAKDLTARCRARALQLTDDEILSITQDLDSVIQNLCDYISKIPSSALGSNAYTGVAVKALSARGFLEDDMLTNTVKNMPNRRSFHDSNMPRLVEFLQGMYHESDEFGGQMFSSLPEVSEYIEPLYDALFCPLANEVMTDPVLTESGVTYERRAIEEYFNRFAGNSKTVICPVTKMPLQNRTLMSNSSLKSVIAEWKMRNEAMRIRIARTALSLSSMDAIVLEAIHELMSLVELRRKNREHMHKIGVTRFLARLLDNNNVQIRRSALELLCLLVEDEEGKDIIGKTKAIPRTIKLLSSNGTDERDAAISFLLELSKSPLLLEDIGSTAGSILILTTMKINDSDDPTAAQKAGEVLKNLEKCSKNIKYMAESGYLEPLQIHLVEGSEEMQMEMVSYLGELVQEQDLTIDISGDTSGVLIKMVHSCNTVARKAALDVLVQLSSHHPNSKTLVEAGVVPVMVEELFIRKVDDDPLSYKAMAAAVLANVVESGIDPDTTVVNKEGHVLTSKYSIYNFVHMLKCFMPDELNLSVIRVLLALTAHAKPLAALVSVVRENHRGHSVVELMSSRTEALGVAATRLLITLSAHMGHTIAERLCRTQGQPRRLVRSIIRAGRATVTERHAAAVTLLSRLPFRNVSLNLALVQEGAVPAILRGIEEMRSGAARTSRHAAPYLEGLVGTLVRLTVTLYNPDVLKAAMDHDFASVLTGLLTGAAGSGGEVQRLAAVGLENLSYHSIKLSRPPPEEEPRPKKMTILMRLKDARVHNHNSKSPPLNVCPVHRGVCSPSTTFCLLEAGAVEGLLVCLENDNPRVVDAALGALCTLVDDRVDVEKAVVALVEQGAARRVLAVLRQHRENRLWQRCFSVVEKLLVHGDDGCVREVTGDRMLPTALVSAFHRGDANAKQAAESILRRLHKMPDYSATYVSLEF
ncbi:putative U-box domain-containing protein 42 [Oryza brachyantha]|uniref:RING-type E3 ubiquitin transferase n=1 Tax=Oryza brachyantha TaxID=4533 RepID=J3LGN7_ORYBR|nr:putative U-box domain-containing protein 42 [Oryza brachyantha]XP_015689567.1 putative U-box domain-containing protein 42 [Oryza brachyantha]